MNAQLAIDLTDSGLTVRAITEKRNGNYVVECAPCEWADRYSARLLKRGWYTVRFGQHIEYAGNVGRIASTEMEVIGVNNGAR